MACLLLVVHGLRSGVGILWVGKPDEPESTAAVGIMVLDDDLRVVSTGQTRRLLWLQKKWMTNSFFNGTEFGESLTEGLISGVPGKAADHG